jgi:L-lactate dehydrogenase complex protein LldG
LPPVGGAGSGAEGDRPEADSSGPPESGDPRRAGRETGDRAAFLGRLEARLAQGIPANPVHPPPPPLDAVPPIVNRTVDYQDLLGTFEAACARASTVVHCIAGPDELRAAVATIVEAEGVTTAVSTAESVTAGAVAELERLGIAVSPYGRDAGARADLGVTGCTEAVAATGSVVLDSAVAGSRGAGLLPRVHLCLVWRDQIVPTVSEILRPLRGHPERLPANLVVVSGPSRTGDIEQLITLGVHGPTRVHIAVMERS